MKTSLKTGMATGAVLAILAGTALGQGERWEWLITPYAFLPSLDVDSTIAGQTVNADLSFEDVWDTFDVKAFAARGEGWKGDWGFVLDGSWTDLNTEAGPADIAIEQFFLDGLAGWRQVQEGGGMVPKTWNLTGGLRYNSLKQEVTLPPGTLGGTEQWLDLMLGARGFWELSEKWAFILRGDIGGFGIGDSADLTASATGGFAWKFASQWSLDAGYRYYYLDYEPTRSDGAFGFDGTEQGLWLGISWMK